MTEVEINYLLHHVFGKHWKRVPQAHIMYFPLASPHRVVQYSSFNKYFIIVK